MAWQTYLYGMGGELYWSINFAAAQASIRVGGGGEKLVRLIGSADASRCMTFAPPFFALAGVG